MNDLRIYQGDCLEHMEWMADESVQCCVTSPPYFGLRDYGVEGQLGLEQTPEQYVQKMVEVFREVRRILKPDGTLWLNLGDSYVRNPAKGQQKPGDAGKQKYIIERGNGRSSNACLPSGMKEKDLIGIPWMVAFALRADGWYLRQDIIWHKPNPMPESVRDRCTKAHEYIFLLTKNERYFFDSEAMKEPALNAGARIKLGAKSFAKGQAAGKGVAPSGNGNADHYDVPAYRNRRSVWTVTTQPFKGAHFATYPPGLIEPCVLAGSRRNDVVFDPFGGSGTTAAVALRHGRRAITCELNPEYVELIKQRIGRELPNAASVFNDEEL